MLTMQEEDDRRIASGTTSVSRGTPLLQIPMGKVGLGGAGMVTRLSGAGSGSPDDSVLMRQPTSRGSCHLSVQECLLIHKRKAVVPVDTEAILSIFFLCWWMLSNG